MTAIFPAVGHRYLVDFVAFRVELQFTSDTWLTYYNVGANGAIEGSETVAIRVEPHEFGSTRSVELTCLHTPRLQ